MSESVTQHNQDNQANSGMVLISPIFHPQLTVNLPRFSLVSWLLVVGLILQQ